MICFQVRKSNIFSTTPHHSEEHFSAVRPYRHSERNKIHIFCTYSDPVRLFFSYISIIFAKSVVLAYSNALL